MRKLILLSAITFAFADTQLANFLSMLQKNIDQVLPIKVKGGEIYEVDTDNDTLTLKMRLSDYDFPNPCNTPLVQDINRHGGVVQYIINDKKTIVCKR